MKTHQMTGTRFHRIWKDMKTRCLNPNYRLFKDYGGRGITVSPEWLKFEGFKSSLYASYLRHSKRYGEHDTFIDRIDNALPYKKENVKWSTRIEQNKNRRMQKLTPEKVEKIRLLYYYGNGRKLARQYGVSPAVISEIVNKKRNYANR